MTMKSRVAGAGVMVLLALGAAAVPLPAMAAKSCKGSSCEGKDPVSYGCTSGATLVEEFTYLDARFRLIHSSKCDSAWTNVISGTYYNTVFGQVRSYDLDTKKRKNVHGVQVIDGSSHTTMVKFTGQWVKGCSARDWFDSDPNHCTDYH